MPNTQSPGSPGNPDKPPPGKPIHEIGEDWLRAIDHLIETGEDETYDNLPPVPQEFVEAIARTKLGIGIWSTGNLTHAMVHRMVLLAREVVSLRRKPVGDKS